MAQSQSNNMEKLSKVLELIEKASNIRLEREAGHEKFEAMMKSLTAGAERRYLRARSEAERLKDVKGSQWPTLPEDRRRVAFEALSAYRAVDDFVKVEKSANEPGEHASMLQRLGVLAYYANYDYQTAIVYLSEAVKLFEEKASEAQFKPAQAWAKHFLGVLKKNWPLRIEAEGTSLREAEQLLNAAEGYLSIASGQFLTPLTHAEVLSYLQGANHAKQALMRIAEVIQAIEERRKKGTADNIQLTLLPRAYLLKGNIAHMQGDRTTACMDFDLACKTGESNPYAWLSLAEASSPEDARAHWEKGLSLLSKPPALERPETLTRMLAFSWGILGSHFVRDETLLKTYRSAFGELAATLERDGQYVPLFFSPTTKTLVDLDRLQAQMEERIS